MTAFILVRTSLWSTPVLPTQIRILLDFCHLFWWHCQFHVFDIAFFIITFLFTLLRPSSVVINICLFTLTVKLSPPEVFYKKDVLRNFAKFIGKHLCQGLFFNKVSCNFIKKETLAQVFSCEFCEIPKNTFFTEHLWTTASLRWCQIWKPKVFDVWQNIKMKKCTQQLSLILLFLH